MTGVDRCRANHCVSTSTAFIRRASTISNARSPNLNIRNGPGRCHQLRRFLIGDEPVPVVDVPVQLLLQCDHPPADALMLGPCRVQSFPRRHSLRADRRRLDGCELLSQRIQVAPELQRQSPRKRELLQLRSGEFVEILPRVSGCEPLTDPCYPLSWLTCLSQKQAVELLRTPSNSR